MADKCTKEIGQATLFELQCNGQYHSFIKIPEELSIESKIDNSDKFNILMADVSGSMSSVWKPLVDGWNKHIVSSLQGTTKIFTFGSDVHFVRNGTELKETDFSGSMTNITSALKKIEEEIMKCSHKNIKVFFITDGEHNASAITPLEQLEQMKCPPNKVIEVYLVGIGDSFPVCLSLKIRSRIHNGNANLPTIFWAKNGVSDIDSEIEVMSQHARGQFIELTASEHGYKVANTELTNNFYSGEWAYYPQKFTELSAVTFSYMDNGHVSIGQCKEMQIGIILNEVFPQWNSILVQRFNNKKDVPMETFELMKSLYTCLFDSLVKIKGRSVKDRIDRKHYKTYEVQFQTLMNASKNLIENVGKFKSEIEMAEQILVTTVRSSKYEQKTLKMKGHDSEAYKADIVAFKKLLERQKPHLDALPEPEADDCCQVLLASTLGDLRDPDFDLLLKHDKFTFLTEFTVTGIPFFGCLTESAQINPWTIVVSNILTCPFEILSQRCIENFARVDLSKLDQDKGIVLQGDNEKTRMNGIIPLIKHDWASVMKPIVRSNIYAMCATFCILKNPHIIDHDVHMAALGCAWVKTITEFPMATRPEFIVRRIDNIIATAGLYIDRKSFATYAKVLSKNPSQALMTESSELFDDDRAVKCQSLVKPVFMLYLIKDKFQSMEILKEVVKVTVVEFIGRCLNSSRGSASLDHVLMQFFLKPMKEDDRQSWIKEIGQKFVDAYKGSGQSLLKEYFTKENAEKGIKKKLIKEMKNLEQILSQQLTIQLNKDKVYKLRDLGSCGDVTLNNLEMWAREIIRDDDYVSGLFSVETLMLLVYHGVLHRESKERMLSLLHGNSKEWMLNLHWKTYEESFAQVQKQILSSVLIDYRKRIEETAMKEVCKIWHEEYMSVHADIVKPMSAEEIVRKAREIGIDVDISNVSSVYKYDRELGLARRACQQPNCPYFLKPNKSINQHLFVERTSAQPFPHCLHLIVKKYGKEGIETVMKELTSGRLYGTNGRKVPKPPALEDLTRLENKIRELAEVYCK